MTTNYYWTHSVTPQFLTLSKDGKIRANSKYHEVLGTWEKLTDRTGRIFWSAGIAYRGVVSGNTRKELKNNLVALVAKKGLTLIASEE